MTCGVPALEHSVLLPYHAYRALELLLYLCRVFESEIFVLRTLWLLLLLEDVIVLPLNYRWLWSSPPLRVRYSHQSRAYKETSS